jgi:Flp pilus assembly protein TadG
LKTILFTIVMVIMFVTGLRFTYGVASVLQVYRQASSAAQQAADAGASQLNPSSAYGGGPSLVDSAAAVQAANQILPSGDGVSGKCTNPNQASIVCTVTEVATVHTGFGAMHFSISQSAKALPATGT